MTLKQTTFIIITSFAVGLIGGKAFHAGADNAKTQPVSEPVVEEKFDATAFFEECQDIKMTMKGMNELDAFSVCVHEVNDRVWFNAIKK